MDVLHITRPLLPDFDRRRKTGKLRNDLEALGMSEAKVKALPLCSDLPVIASREQAMGCLYVLEGATLGRQIITRHVCEAFGVTPANGCSFFSSYQDKVGSMWRAFCQQLCVYDHDSYAPQDMVMAAQQTFSTLHKWL